MRTLTRFSVILAILSLVLAACGGAPAGGTPRPGGDGASPGGTQTAGGDPETVCAEDEFGCAEYPEGDPIRIGTALVITGANEALGLDSQYGVEVAVDMRGQVQGRDVEIDFQDDQCSAEGGTTAARALVSDPSILAVIGTSCSSAGIPAAEILSGEGVLLISPSNTAPSLTAPDTHQPFYLRTAHNDEVQGRAMAQFVCEELGLETAATIHDGSPYAEQLQQVFADSFQETCDGTITTQEAIGVGETEFGGVLTSIAADAPQFLYYPIFVAEGALITTQARETAGLEDTALAGSDGIYTPDFLEAAGDAAEGMYISGPNLEFGGEFYENDFLPAYTEVSGEEAPISVFHAHAFDATNMLFDAIDQVAIQGDDGTLYIPRTALRDAIFATENYEGITGNLTCNENGDCADPEIAVTQVENGEFNPIFTYTPEE